MRIVLDTNVVVSALIWGGVPFRLLEAAAEGEVDLVTSPSLLAELNDVLLRAHLATRLQRVRGSVEEALAFYAALTLSVAPDVVSRVVPDDPDDDQIVAAALAGGAKLIVSGDRHLLSVATYRDLKILKPGAALAAIAERTP